MTDDSSDLSSLSSLSPVPTDVESDGGAEEKNGIMKFFPKLGKGQKGKHVDAKKSASPPPRKRSPSPPHEYVLADNPDIAVSPRASMFSRWTRLVARPTS